MIKELIIQTGEKYLLFAILENGNLYELHRISNDITFSVGDIYLGEITKISTYLNAAFLNIGFEKEAFINYNDIGTNIKVKRTFINLMKYEICNEKKKLMMY